MSKEKKQAVGKTALDAFFSTTATAQAEQPEVLEHREQSEQRDSHKKNRFTAHVDPGTVEMIKNICYWDRLTLTEFAESAFRAEIERRENNRGKPYPHRDGELKPGRPVR